MKYERIKIFKENLPAIIAFLVLLVMLILECFIPEFNRKSEAEKLQTITGDYQVLFPYNDDKIYFEKGWHSQSDGENYRWVMKDSTFSAILTDQKVIRLSGYVPYGVDAQNAILYINGKRVAAISISGEQSITLEGNIEKYLKKNKKNKFRIVFDKERIPDADEDDQRVLSAMFTSIEFE